MAINRAVTFIEPGKMEIQEREFPKLQDPKGRKIEHAAILKLVTTNICGSDLHIYHGRFAAPKGMQMGHENTGEVIEVGSHVERIRKGDICSVPFNVACGTCRNCRERHTDVWLAMRRWTSRAPRPCPIRSSRFSGRASAGSMLRWIASVFECHGYGPQGRTKNDEEAVINMLMEVALEFCPDFRVPTARSTSSRSSMQTS
jgi:threonine dehydrogenase-like Zn-dependent dehydrogenase